MRKGPRIDQTYTKNKKRQAAKANNQAKYGSGPNGGGTMADMVEAKSKDLGNGVTHKGMADWWKKSAEDFAKMRRKKNLKDYHNSLRASDKGDFKTEENNMVENKEIHVKTKKGHVIGSVWKSGNSWWSHHHKTGDGGKMRTYKDAIADVKQTHENYLDNKRYIAKEETQTIEQAGRNMFEAMRGRFNKYYGNPDRKSMHNVMPKSDKPIEKPKDTFDSSKGIAAAKARLAMRKARWEETEQLDELSKKTLGSYIKKAGADLHKRNKQKDAWKENSKNLNKRINRVTGIEQATDKLSKEETEQLDELSKKTLGSYLQKGSENLEHRTRAAAKGKGYKGDSSKLNVRIAQNRAKGIKTSAKKFLSKEETRLATIKSVILEAVHSKGGGKKGKAGAKGEDTEGDSHPINIARKAIGLGFPVTLHHHNKEKTQVTPQMGHHIIHHYGNLTKPHEKEEMVHHMWASPAHLQGYLGGKKLELSRKKAWQPGQPIPERSKKHLKAYGLPNK